MKILEIACGTGMLFEKIVSMNPDGVNIGTDLSPAMLKKAKARLANHPGSFELLEGDALHPAFDDNTFDIIINNFMVDLMPRENFDRIANEFYRMLRPGGLLALSTFSFGTKKVHSFWYWVARHFPGLLTGCRPVSFNDYLASAGFRIDKCMEISQNTFPSVVIIARKVG